LCFLFLSVPAFAQGDVTFVGKDNIGLDVAFQLGAIGSGQDANELTVLDGIGGIGGRVGYYLGSFVFLDGEVLHKFSGCLFEPCSNEKPTILGGIRLGTVFDDWIGVFAKARAGAFGFNSENRYTTLESAKKFYPVFDIGIMVERYFENNFFIRVDIGDWIIPFGDTKIVHTEYGPEPDFLPVGTNTTRIGTTHNFAFEFGFGFRF
jgi:hypothetical protein